MTTAMGYGRSPDDDDRRPDADADAVPPAVAAERKRIASLLAVVLDDAVYEAVNAESAAVQRALRTLSRELGRLRRFVREGGTVADFLDSRAGGAQ